MSYLFTSESVSEGHPDKVADQISDAILDQFLAFDSGSKVACETLVTTGQVVLAGEIKSSVYIDVQEVAREVIRNIGYTKDEYKFSAESCGVLTALHEQSQDINQGVDRGSIEEQGAGDQGMMFGYATNETKNYMPLALDLSHKLLKTLADIRKAGQYMTYLRPDAKAQVTIEYDDHNKPVKIKTIVLSTQHDSFSSEKEMRDTLTANIQNHVMPRVLEQLESDEIKALFNDDITYHINPTGNFVIGGPHGDAGLTGRKIIVDTYGGKGAHGGGAFSGKDPSKVDRSAAYATRHIAKNMVAAGVADEMLVQVSYAIGVVEPMGVFVNTYETSKVNMTDGEIARKIQGLFDLRPGLIEKNLKLRNPIYGITAAYGHMGRDYFEKEVSFIRHGDNGKEVKKLNLEFFTWEKLDRVDEIKKAFNLK